MRLGYTIVDAGWQGDVANVPGSNVLFPDLPVATQPDGSPIIAAVRIEYSDRTIPATGTFSLPLEGSPSFDSYPTADTNTAHSPLTVRDSDRTIPATGTFSLPLEGSPSFDSYPTADTNTAHSPLTVRDQVSDQGPMTPIAAKSGRGRHPAQLFVRLIVHRNVPARIPLSRVQ
jgi:hypothetical protein